MDGRGSVREPPSRGEARRGEARPLTPALGALDDCRFVDPVLLRDVDSARTSRVPKGCAVYLRGWALLDSPLRIPAGARLKVGDVVRNVTLGRPRPEVAETNGDPALAGCGFALVSSLATLRLGRHELVIDAVDGAGAHEIARRAFEVVSSRAFVADKTRAPAGSIAIQIDAVETRRGLLPHDDSPTDATIGETVTIHGWAVDLGARRAVSAIYATVDGDQFVVGNPTGPREDVPDSLAMPAARRCGFAIRVPTAQLATGRHSLAVCAVSSDGATFADAVVGYLVLTR